MLECIYNNRIRFVLIMPWEGGDYGWIWQRNLDLQLERLVKTKGGKEIGDGESLTIRLLSCMFSLKYLCDLIRVDQWCLPVILFVLILILLQPFLEYCSDER